MKSGSEYPRISIVTPSLNQASFLEDTICSVLRQGYPNLEYIVIDGGSTDGSVDIIKKYEKSICFWSSAKDQGQASAINKGLRMISGEIWSFLNSDDTYSPDALNRIVRAFHGHPDAEVVYGNCNFINENNLITRVKKPGPYNRKKMLKNNYLYQPAVFARSEVLQRYGFFDESLRFSMDYEYWLRFDNDKRFVYIDEPIANYRLHASSKTIHDTVKMMREMVAVKKKYGMGVRADWIYWNFFVWGRHYYRAKRYFFNWLAEKKAESESREKR
jgi:glycosyltransferase involved in cell wall biosynthesis